MGLKGHSHFPTQIAGLGVVSGERGTPLLHSSSLRLDSFDVGGPVRHALVRVKQLFRAVATGPRIELASCR